MRKRLGIYGGTFDPVHHGHLRVAKAVLESFSLNELIFVPAFVPPHKRGIEISAPHHRYAMLALATMGEPQMRISTIELEAPARPYTVETMAHLQAEHSDAALFFVMGMDSFRDITLWRDYETLLTRYHIVVAARPGYQANSGTDWGAHLPAHVRARVVDLCGGLLPNDAQLSAPHIFVTDYVAENVSATAIRTAVESHERIESLVPTVVADYVRKYSLYTA